MNTHAPIDKSTWGDGPWQAEPDRVEWEHAGLPCLALRNENFGVWCGYAAVAPGHPLHGKDHGDVEVSVHGGLTYANRCDGDRICHVPKPGEADDVWWFGFDCGHCFDFMPAFAARHALLLEPLPRQQAYDHNAAVNASSRLYVDVYRTLNYVQDETNALAEQLAKLGQPPPVL